MEGICVTVAEPTTFEPNVRPDCTADLTATLSQRIMVIDGGSSMPSVPPAAMMPAANPPE